MVMESRPACDDNEDTEATTSDDEKHDWVPYPPGHRKNGTDQQTEQATRGDPTCAFTPRGDATL